MVLTETKLTNKRYPKVVSGYHVIALKAASPHQGKIVVLWRPGHWDFEVEAVHIASPNILTFQLVTGSYHTIIPLSHYNVVVVLLYDDKSADLRVHSWPGNCLFSSFQFSPRTPRLARTGSTC
jgi:hypothetical protein